MGRRGSLCLGHGNTDRPVCAEEHRVQIRGLAFACLGQRPQFIRKAFQQFCMEYGIKNVYLSPRYPQSNGQAEITSKTLLGYLKKCLTTMKGKWVYELPIRSGPIVQLGGSPPGRPRMPLRLVQRYRFLSSLGSNHFEQATLSRSRRHWMSSKKEGRGQPYK